MTLSSPSDLSFHQALQGGFCVRGRAEGPRGLHNQRSHSPLCHTTAGEDPGLLRAIRRGVEVFAARLPGSIALMFEETIKSLARAAEQLSENATPLEIRDRAAQSGCGRIWWCVDQNGRWSRITAYLC